MSSSNNQYSVRYNLLEVEVFDDVSNQWIELENDVMNDNSNIISSIFGINNTGNSVTSNDKLLTLSDQINLMTSIKDDSLTNSELNLSNMYVYKFNIVYLVFKIFLFFLFLFIVYKIITSTGISPVAVAGSINMAMNKFSSSKSNTNTVTKVSNNIKTNMNAGVNTNVKPNTNINTNINTNSKSNPK